MDSLSLGECVKKLGGPYEGYGEMIISKGIQIDDLSTEPGRWGDLGQCIPLHKAIIRAVINEIQTQHISTPVASAPTPVGDPSAQPAAAPFPKDGISFACIDEFIAICGGESALKGLSTAVVSAEAVMPLTYLQQSSYCDKLKRSGGSGTASVGTPIAFISHAWKYTFLDVIKALRHHFKDEPDISSVCIWLDIFTNPQHTAPNLDFTWWSTTFKSAIRDIGRTVVVLTPWTNPIPFTRAWCLFEIYSTVDTGSAFEVAMSPSEQASFVESAAQDLSSLHRMISIIDVKKSQAFNPLDLKQIFEVVEKTCGFDTINAIVMERIRDWVVATVKAASDGAGDARERLDHLYTLGLLYDSLGMLQSAAEIQEQCIEDFKVFEASDSHSAIQRMNNLAICYDRMGRYGEAAALLEQCLDSYRRILGEDHKDFYNTMSSLSMVYLHQSSYDKALPLTERSLEYFKRSQGEESQVTLNSMSSLAIILDSMQRPQDALPVLEECVRLKKRVLGEQHPDTLMSLNSLALVHLNLRQYQLSVDLFAEVLRAKRVKLGSKHASTLKGIGNLAHLYSQLGAYEHATVLFQEALEGHYSVLGKEHKDTVLCQHNMCCHYLLYGYFERALPLCESLVENAKKTWPESEIGKFFQVHRDCVDFIAAIEGQVARLPDSLQFEQHEHALRKVHNPYGSETGCICDICGKSFSGWVFHCSECSFDVHTDCAVQRFEQLAAAAAIEGTVDSGSSAHVETAATTTTAEKA